MVGLSSPVRSDTGGTPCWVVLLDLARPRRPLPLPRDTMLEPTGSPFATLLLPPPPAAADDDGGGGGGGGAATDDEGCGGLVVEAACPFAVGCNVTLVLPNKSAASTSAG